MKPNRTQTELTESEILTLELIDNMEYVDGYSASDLQVYLQF